ncbi:hypothetical protein GT370_18595 [Acidocella sp. MX-AZ03]|uniref:hypothetical protein n=1 Tax=Acidocella sp. MX-AZ03 TaxID=2697363 RepID=UPI0022DD487D|nr:hypothetical protein [Acidocella sp. MX-AZ03]WBO59059.1 hypothetical protein GT370_18595 [Acidocella sp. MX-AZ03]
MPGRKAVRAIVPIAHGAAMVLLDAAGTRLLAPDYEDPAFTQTQPAYRAQRPPFAETLSPPCRPGSISGRRFSSCSSDCRHCSRAPAACSPTPNTGPGGSAAWPLRRSPR